MFLGLDLGTSEIKSLLLDAQGHVVATAKAPLSIQHPRPLWAEQSPSDWWVALEAVMHDLQRRHPRELAQLQGVGLAGQMHGAVLLDVNDRVLRPAILWHDSRSQAQCQQLTALVPDLHSISGNLAMPGFTAPKLLWMREHEPATFAQVRRVLLPKDWLRLRLSGEMVSDMSDAAGTLWLDTARRQWSDALLGACGLDRSYMPRLIEGNDVSGFMRADLCQRWGLPSRVPIAGGAGDNAASAIGMGIISAGAGFVSLGTSGVVFVASDHFEPNPAQAVHAFCHALPQRWHQMSVMLSAASAVTWAAKRLGYENETELLADAAKLQPNAQDTAPIFLPYLSGERSPHNNPNAQAGWFGMTASHGREHLAWSVAEGVGFGLRDGLLTLTRNSLDADLSLVGGGARSVWWSQLLSHVLGQRLHIHAAGETAGALGAARLGWLAAGALTADVCTPPPTTCVYEPDSSTHQRLAHRHQKFRALYSALQNQFSLKQPVQES